MFDAISGVPRREMDDHAPIDIRAILRLPVLQRGKALALLLSLHVDKKGYFRETPKNLLAAILPGNPYDNHSRARHIVVFLCNQKWLTNTGSGGVGIWRLSIERLGETNNALQRAEAVRVAANLRQRYSPEMIDLIAWALKDTP